MRTTGLSWRIGPIAIASLAAALAVALTAASPAHAACTTVGSATGTAGSDRMCGTTGPDSMNGLGGEDRLTGGDGKDTLLGGDGDDTVEGGDGDDVLVGGLGQDKFFGDSGNDTLRARDGEFDSIILSQCGSGTDSLDLDLIDALPIGLPLLGAPLLFLQCEKITVGAVNEGPNVRISRRTPRVPSNGKVPVRLSCPASLSAPCAGKLRIGRSKNSQGAPKAYSFRQGTKRNVSAHLSRRDRRRLLRRGKITASATSIERGEFGDKTTVQTLTLIARD